MKRTWVKASLFFFFIAACIGALLRWAFVSEVQWLDFRFFMHAHSHLAILGWVFLMLYTFLVHTFLSPAQQFQKKYKVLFRLLCLSCAGMMVSFPIQGYAFWSISFSTLHIIFSYAFTWFFLKDIKAANSGSLASVRFAKTALAFMVLSTLALWAMGPLMASDWRGSALYYATIQFYLHFQFNGWFIFALIALLFKLLEDKNAKLPEKQLNIFYILLIVSCFFTYALAVAWSNPLPVVFWINSIGVVIQLLALIYFFAILQKVSSDLKSLFSGKVRLFMGIAVVCFVAKILMQTAVVIPEIAKVSYTIRNFVIGFIHLILLGTVSHFIFGYALKTGLLKMETLWSRFGLYIFVTGFFLTEFTLFFQGILLWAAQGFFPYYYEILFLLSALLPLSLLLILAGESFQGSSKSTKITPRQGSQVH